MQSRRERKKAATRQHIMHVAMDLFAKQGVKAITMEQIAEQADIAKGTLYKYFPEKEAIVAANTEEVIADFTAGLHPLLENQDSARNRILAIFDKFLNLGLKHQAHFRTYMHYRLNNMVNQHQTLGFSSSLEDIFHQIISAGQDKGEIRAELPAKGLAHNLEMSLLMNCLTKIQDNKAPYNPSLMVDLFFEGAGRAYRSAD